jgi:outer membrane usher protein
LAQAPAPDVKATAAPAAPAAGAAAKLNPTKHAVTLILPAMVDNFYLGDISVTIQPDDQVQFSTQRLVELLSPILAQAPLESLRARFTGTPVAALTDFDGTGVKVAYNPKTLQFVIIVPSEMRIPRGLSVANLGGAQNGKFVDPASLAAYLNVRGMLDYVEKGTTTGLRSPLFYLDGALWTSGVGLESEGIWQPGVSASGARAFQRQGTRLVFDDLTSPVRLTVGDLQPVGSGFQSVPSMSGLSLYRSYSALQPLVSVRPTGDQTFQLTRASDVRVTVNGSDVRYIHLAPGSYNLRDFPFSQGANDISVLIQDDAGRQETLHYNVFFDQTQLAPGLSEFGLFTGVKSPLANYGPHYTNDWMLSGFYRYGVSQALTVGANVQSDAYSTMAGLQALFGTSLGTFSFDLAGSSIGHYGRGYAATLNYQRLFQFVNGQGDSLNLAVTTRSKNFGAVGSLTPNNIYGLELSGGYTHAFNELFYGSLTAHYSKARSGYSDVHDYHAIVGYRLTDRMGLTVDTSYQEGGFNKGFGVLVSLTWRPGDSGSLRGDFNSRRNDARLSYQDIEGNGVGSYNVFADVDRADDGTSVNAGANYIGNRGEVGINQFSSMDAGFGGANNIRTTLHASTALAFADGAVSVGRPVLQSFAIVETHKSLGSAPVYVEPTPNSYEASSEVLGTALDSSLSAYVPRTVTVSVPDAPTGYDVGSGTFRLNPPYRGGYKLVVGSDYSVTVIGRLLMADGKPVSLIAGNATEVSKPDRPPVQIFTNAQGKFGLSGLRPGKWQIVMATDPAIQFLLTVPETANGVVRAGDLTPSEMGK